MTVNYQDLGLRVRDARKAKHLTQEQLAEKVGISSSFMGHIERGTRIASIDTLVSICNVLSVSPCLLLGASLSENAVDFPYTNDNRERSFMLDFVSLAQRTVRRRLVFRQVPQQALAAAQNIAVCPVKVIRIPRIFNVALPLGKVQQQMQLRLLLLRTQSTQLLQVPPLHADNQIRRFKILRRNLPRTMLRAGHPVLDQNSARRRINPIANFLAAQCGGIHFKLARHMPLLCQVPEHHCCHRTAANIAVTHK